jgi:hypothetical protein
MGAVKVFAFEVVGVDRDLLGSRGVIGVQDGVRRVAG